MHDTKIQGGEFIEREKQLPPEDSPGYVAQGYTEKSASDLAITPIGSPPVGYDVRSVYDSRPVNGYDFNIAVTVTIEEGPGNTFLAEFNVRQGFVGVLREVHHFFTDDPTPPIIRRSQCLLTIQRNGVNVADNEDIPVGAMSDALWKGFVIGDENDVLAALIVLQGTLEATECVVHFYGNYLLKSGIAYPFQIANPTCVPCDGAAPMPPPAIKPVPVMPPILPSGPLPDQGIKITWFRKVTAQPVTATRNVSARSGGSSSGSSGSRGAARAPEPPKEEWIPVYAGTTRELSLQDKREHIAYLQRTYPGPGRYWIADPSMRLPRSPIMGR